MGSLSIFLLGAVAGVLTLVLLGAVLAWAERHDAIMCDDCRVSVGEGNKRGE